MILHLSAHSFSERPWRWRRDSSSFPVSLSSFAPISLRFRQKAISLQLKIHLISHAHAPLHIHNKEVPYIILLRADLCVLHEAWPQRGGAETEQRDYQRGNNRRWTFFGARGQCGTGWFVYCGTCQYRRALPNATISVRQFPSPSLFVTAISCRTWFTSSVGLACSDLVQILIEYWFSFGTHISGFAEGVLYSFPIFIPETRKSWGNLDKNIQQRHRNDMSL